MSQPPVLFQEGGASASGGGGILVVPDPVNVQQAITAIEKPRDPADKRQKTQPTAKQVPKQKAKAKLFDSKHHLEKARIMAIGN